MRRIAAIGLVVMVGALAATTVATGSRTHAVRDGTRERTGNSYSDFSGCSHRR